jgi:hypothetical protein
MVSTDLLHNLAAQNGGTRISIYIPTERAGPETQQNRIWLKNELQKVEAALEEAPMRKPEIDALLKPARELLDDDGFWEHREEGLAVFISEGQMQHYSLAGTPEAGHWIGEHYHLTPLLSASRPDGRYYLLNLSQNHVQLLVGNRGTLKPVKVEGMPTSLAEALPFDQYEKQLQHHTSSSSPGGKGQEGSFHGQGTPGDEEKDAILRFLQQVAAAVNTKLAGGQAPLLIAGVEYLHPIYTAANSYLHLMQEGLRGNLERATLQELHEQSWPLVEPHFVREAQDAAARYANLSGGDQVAAALEAIVPAAYAGQVEALLVRRGAEVWGEYDLEANQVRKEGEQELVNYAIRQTLANSGQVYVFSEDDMPADTEVAAILRY